MSYRSPIVACCELLQLDAARQLQIYLQSSSTIWTAMIQPEEVVEAEWAEWYRLTPIQRWLESEKLWQTYLGFAGTLDPKPDTQSPFFDARSPRPRVAHGRTGVRVLR